MKGYSNPFAVPTAVLARCDDEPIERPGAIQGHGVVLVVDIDTVRVRFASDNAAEFLGGDRDAIFSTDLDCILTPVDSTQSIRALLQNLQPASSLLIRVATGPGAWCYAHLHHADSDVIIDLEPAAVSQPPVFLPAPLDAISRTTSFEQFARVLTDTVADLTGFDRVMVYRFDDAFNGEIIAETRTAQVDSFLGMRFPASDIPPRARALYGENRCRILVDRDAPASRLVAATVDPTGARADSVDLTRSHLRAVSPVHLEYLFNMGVQATLVASLMCNGKIWGLIACHHHNRRFLDPAQRSILETLSVASSGQVANLAYREQNQAQQAAAMHRSFLRESAESGVAWLPRIFEAGCAITDELKADGFVLLTPDADPPRVYGLAPASSTLQGITNALLSMQAGTLAWDNLATLAPELADVDPACAGLLVIRPHSTWKTFLVWTREERKRKVTWAGRPVKVMAQTEQGVRLSPRKSFERWEAEVAGFCEPWRERERVLAETLFTQLAIAHATLLAQEREEAIQALRKKESTLAEASRRLLDALQASPDAFISYDADGVVLAHNASASKLIGEVHGVDVSVGMNLPERLGAPANERLLGWLELARQGESFSQRITYTTGNAEPRWALVDGRPSTDPESGGLFLSARDFTQDQISNEQARALELRMLQTQQMEGLSMLAGGVAHDFNNLLVGIRCNTELVVSDAIGLDVEHREALEDVIAASEMAADLTRQLLAYAGRGRGSVETFDLVELTRTMLPMTRTRDSRLEARLLTAPADLQISADPTQVRQVLLNLIVNALEAVDSRDGDVTVSLSIAHAGDLAGELEQAQFNATTGAGHLAVVDVTDNGCGMDSETLARVLEPFFSTRFTGRGLGLAAVVGVVRVHEGAILMRSAPGEGTSMRVYLPATTELNTGDYLTINGGARAAMLLGTISTMQPIASALRREVGLQTVMVESLTELVAVRDRLGRALRIAVLEGGHPLLRDGRAAQFLRSQRPDLMIIQLGGERMASSASPISVHMEQWPPQAVVRIAEERLRLSGTR
jgi:light-regulated signal transduction histidine kinase (bacteriophytochrome)